MTEVGDGALVSNPYGLSLREAEVVSLLVGGRTGKDVAKLLQIDRREIARHRAAAMRKFRARNGSQLAHLVAVTGLTAFGLSVARLIEMGSIPLV